MRDRPNIVHIDLRSLSEDYADLRYSQENLNAFEPRRLPLAQIADLIDLMERDYYVTLPEDYATTGRRLYDWIDGSDRALSSLLAGSGTTVLAIALSERLAHLPWEVMHDKRGFLVARSQPVIPVRWRARREGDRLIWAEGEVPNRPLQMLFMATSPVGVEPVLDFEGEEGRILAATKRQPLSLRVEESGCLDELENLLASYERDHFDVVHLSGHAWISEDGPRFVTETETGDRADVSSDEIAKALQFRFPAVMFLSGCRTGESGRGSGGAGEVPSMAAALLTAGANAVLGWGRPVRDVDGILAAEALYKALSEAKTLPEALALTYQAMIRANAQDKTQGRDWHLLRLYVTGEMPQNLVTPLRTARRQKAQRPSMATEFLDAAEQVKVASRESFVGRRRPLQACLRSLRDPDGVGVLLYGMGGLGKSSLAARICDRLTYFERVVLFGLLDEAALVNSLAGKLADLELKQRVEDPNVALTDRLREVFEADLARPFLLVLDDFEANLEPVAAVADEKSFRLKATEQANPARVWKALKEALAAAESVSAMGHRLVITCRYDFELGGGRLAQRLYKQPLARLQQADLDKKCRQLAAFGDKSTIEPDLRQRAMRLADGNPRLLEWLDKVLRHPEALGPGLAAKGSVAAVLDRLEAEPEELREQVLADVLLAQIDAPMREMLARAAVYELPVPRAAILEIGEAGADRVAIEGLIARSVALGLLEQSADEGLRVPRVLGFGSAQPTAIAAQAAQVLYRLWWEEAESSSEVQRLEMHRLAVEGEKGEIAKEIAYQLAGHFRTKSRYREAISLCQKTNGIDPNYKVLKELATSAREVGDVVLAERSFQEALQACPEKDENLRASIAHELAILKANQGDVEGAIALYQQSLEIKEKIGNVQGKAATLHCLAILKANQGDVEGAIALYQQVAEIDEQTGDVQGKATTLHQLAILKANQGDVEGAIALYQQSLEIDEQIGNVQGKAATLHNLASLKANQGDVEGAIALYQQSLEITEKIGDVKTKAATLHQLAILKANQGDVEGAIALYQQVSEIDEQTGDVQGKAATLHQLAILKANQGDVEGAIALYNQSLEIKEKIGNVKGKAATLHQLAMLKANQGDVEGAIALYNQSLEITEKIGDVQGKAVTLHNLAILKANQGDVEGAIALYNQSLEIKEKIGDVQGKAITLGMMGQLLADEKGDFETAIPYLQESLAIFQQIGSPNARIAQDILNRITGDSQQRQQPVAKPNPLASAIKNSLRRFLR